MIENISFVVIARNEAFAVNKCLGSIASMALRNCEVICVDSDSMDGTVATMKRYVDKIENLSIIQLSGFMNAAVARNAGMQFVTKEYIFFVDGDVELYPEFITAAVDRIQSGKADAVTGKLLEIQYTSDYKNVIRRIERRGHIKSEKTCLMTGGIVIVSRVVAEMVGEWDSIFWRMQDLDYTLRISRVGTLLQLPLFIGIHHTQEFHDRSWANLRKGHPLLYGRLLRKNFDMPTFTITLLRINRGLATFLLSGIVLLTTLVAARLAYLTSATVGLALILFLSLDCLYSTCIKQSPINQWFLHNYIEPPLILLGLIWSSKKREAHTDIITIC